MSGFRALTHGMGEHCRPIPKFWRSGERCRWPRTQIVSSVLRKTRQPTCSPVATTVTFVSTSGRSKSAGPTTGVNQTLCGVARSRSSHRGLCSCIVANGERLLAHRRGCHPSVGRRTPFSSKPRFLRNFCALSAQLRIPRRCRPYTPE